MDSTDILAVLREEATPPRPETGAGEGAAAVRLQGLNSTSTKALYGQEMIIRYFPFRIGRMENYPNPLSEGPDLLLEDHPPFHISRLHLGMERRGSGIVLTDPDSSSGSIVDGRLLGERRGGPAEILLGAGKHEIRLGGTASPYQFSLYVVTAGEVFGIDEEVSFDDRTVPVAVLYGRLHQQTRMVFDRFFTARPQSLELAYTLINSLLTHPEAIDPLYHFSALPEMYDDVIVTHSLNVVIYTLKLAATLPLPLPSEDRKRLALAALFHDIGMYDIPLEIVNKREMVTAAEFEVIKRHPVQGRAWLAESGVDNLLTSVVLTHHERIDGQGYPRGVKDLTEYAEVVALVDYFEAITHERPQRGPITPHEGMRRIIDLKKAIFSPPLLRQFIAGFSLYPAYSIVRLNSGETGQVVRTNRNAPLRPTIRIFFDRNGKTLPEGANIDLAKNSTLYIARDISDRVFVDQYFKL
ncbi:MAG: HD-GYP domain-containing protein [Syntrophales bacterium]